MWLLEIPSCINGKRAEDNVIDFFLLANDINPESFNQNVPGLISLVKITKSSLSGIASIFLADKWAPNEKYAFDKQIMSHYL